MPKPLKRLNARESATAQQKPRKGSELWLVVWLARVQVALLRVILATG